MLSKKDQVTGKLRNLHKEQLLRMYPPSHFWWQSIINDALSIKNKASKIVWVMNDDLEAIQRSNGGHIGVTFQHLPGRTKQS
jgi:hypothetical protein